MPLWHCFCPNLLVLNNDEIHPRTFDIWHFITKMPLTQSIYGTSTVEKVAYTIHNKHNTLSNHLCVNEMNTTHKSTIYL